MIFVPLSSIATAGIEKEQTGSASVAVQHDAQFWGLCWSAAIATCLSVRERIHSARIVELASWSNQNLVERFHDLSIGLAGRGADFFTAKMQALAVMDNIVRREAYMMSFNDCFLLLGVCLLVAGLAIFGCKKVDISASSAPSH